MLLVPKWGQYRNSAYVPLLLITKWRVGGDNWEVMTYDMCERFEEQRGIRDDHHIVLFMWSNIITVNEVSETQEREGGFEVLLKTAALSKVIGADPHQPCGRDGRLWRES